MKRRIGGLHEIQTADGLLEKQFARNAAQLRRISRFLQVVTANGTAGCPSSAPPPESFVQNLAHDTERESTRLKTRPADSPICGRVSDLLTPRERPSRSWPSIVQGLLLTNRPPPTLGTAVITDQDSSGPAL